VFPYGVFTPYRMACIPLRHWFWGRRELNRNISPDQRFEFFRGEIRKQVWVMV
jgi:hypothetical protein